MSVNTTFHADTSLGWRMGLANILRYENARWRRTRRWWINLLIWTAIVNGILLASLLSDAAEAAGIFRTPEQKLGEAMMIFAVASGLFGAIGAVIGMQGTLIDEKKSGTAAWIMSKPVSRTAFIIAKLVANGIALPLIVVVLQSIGVYLLVSVKLEVALPLGQFAAGVGLICLHMLFYVTLTLMLGAFFSDRGPVIGIPIALIFCPMLLGGLLGEVAYLTPWLLVPAGSLDSLSVQALTGAPLTTPIPIFATIIWCAIFVVAAIWRFKREEF
mgnify:CR=1 FL=1